MSFILKKLAYQISEYRMEKAYRKMKKKFEIVVDISILLEETEFKRLLSFIHVNIPRASFDHLKAIKRRGVRDFSDNGSIQRQAEKALKVISHRIDQNVKKYVWTIGGSYGTGRKGELAQTRIADLSQETLKELQRKKKIKTSYISLGSKEVLGSPYDRKLRVLATAVVLQEQGEKVVLATRDINMLAIAEDKKFGLRTVSSLVKTHLLDKYK